MEPRRRLVFRVYAFAAALSIAIMAALLILPRYTRGARYLEPQAALFQYMLDRWSLKDAGGFAESMARIEPRLRGKLTIFSIDGAQLRTTVEPPLERPTAEERDLLRRDKWALSRGRIVVRSDDATMIGVYAPKRPGFPWTYVLPICAAMLVLVGAASVWFARRLARPLDQLATAARRFGAGEIAARADLARNDELGDVGRAFDDMAERTSRVMQAQRQLMADVSHELRTPLARIRVALELAAEDPVASKDVLADVGCDLDEIDQLIEDILTTARLDGQHAQLTRRSARVSELAGKAAQRFATRHPRRTLETAVTAGDRDISCDPLLLRRALDNLLDNAAKYSDPAAPVRLAVHPNGSHVAFEICDRGIGMTPEELEQAFTPFWRADGSRTRRTGGVGLGLALARRIARAHGGEVTLESAPGQGTKAVLDVPTAA
ncbi:MAG: HAMP domain-containing histidine kinase [Myxococcota bacterium]|nr:HAMP domain-containing histidine kinase [Myxococcota bacterium]